MKNWKTLKTETIYKGRLFNLQTQKCELADGRIMPAYYIFDFEDWANVVPLTKKREVVLIKQYRHAVGEVCYEIPGGGTEPKEAPLSAAKRELREETGYTSDNWLKLGEHYPNPALLNNKMHTFLATGCEITGAQKLDPFEEIEVLVKSIDEVKDMLFSGKITHSLMAASLTLAINHLEQQ